jgi:hypothetical protein
VLCNQRKEKNEIEQLNIEKNRGIGLEEADFSVNKTPFFTVSLIKLFTKNK